MGFFSRKSKEKEVGKEVKVDAPPPPPKVNDLGDLGVDGEEEDYDLPPTSSEFNYRKRKGRCRGLHDGTIEYFDKYSNLDVGTEFDTSFRGEASGFTALTTENYAFIIDLDFYEYQKIGFKHFLGEILQSAFFRFSILGLVLINSILIGINTYQQVVQDNKSLYQALDHVIFSIFFFEILLKWLYDFRLFWLVWWNILDFTIVFLIVLSSMVPIIGRQKEIFAMIRVVRAFRILRSVSSFTSLNVVTHTIVKSLGDMLNILFVLILFMFVMAIAGVTLFDLPELETTHFQTTFDAWYVLFVCVTQDGWVSIMDEFRPDVDELSDTKRQYFIMIAIYLMFGVAIGAFVFTNLIVAVVVANLELAVQELRAEKLLIDNPLEYHGEFSAQVIEVLSVYKNLASNNVVLLGQRPMKIPNLQRISPRVIQTYLALIVALEQNMLEFVLIERDLKKVMGVLLAIGKQLEGDPGAAGNVYSTKTGKDLLFSLDFFKKLELPKDKEAEKPEKVNFPGADIKKSKKMRESQ